jgi:hypothetical protein
MLLVKIEEATEEIVNLKERIRRLEAEKLEIELQVNLKVEQVNLPTFFALPFPPLPFLFYFISLFFYVLFHFVYFILFILRIG